MSGIIRLDPLMCGYFIVAEPSAPDCSFVAGFSDQNLAVSFAVAERAAGRELVVLDGATGEQLFPLEEEPGHRPRHSGLRLRPSSVLKPKIGGNGNPR